MPKLLASYRILVSALLVALAWLAAPSAIAQTISNTARATWVEGAEARETSSNTVSFAVSLPPAKIETLRSVIGIPDPAAFKASRCGGANLNVTGTTGIAGGLAATNSVAVGETLFVRVFAPSRNQDPNNIDSLDVVVVGSNGDREVLTIFETGIDTGIFLGALPTADIPPAPVAGDCRVSVKSGDAVTIEYAGPDAHDSLRATVNILADPYGLVFDSEDGSPVDDAVVSLVDATTGAPATVFADDGVTAWPSSVTSGRPITDGAGGVHPMAAGEYRFPLVALGTYRIVVSPPQPYVAPSKLAPGQMTALRRPDGNPMEIQPGSFGQNFALSSPAAIRVDIPVDRPSVAVGLTKQASRQTAVPGDQVLYTIQIKNNDPSRAKRGVVVYDEPSQSLRIRKDSVRIDGIAMQSSVDITRDGRKLTVNLGDVVAGAVRTVTYLATVRADAAPGQAINRVQAIDSLGNSARASAAVKIERDVIQGRMTLIGRVLIGGCSSSSTPIGLAGVRIMLEDGSFAVTDANGRYHFEGVVPGTHVVQALAQTLPKGGQFVSCGETTRSAGSESSRFIIGQGGSLAVEDFVVSLPHDAAVPPAPSVEVAVQSDRTAAGADTDWLAMGDGPNAFLFPKVDHNPRAPVVRVVIRHRTGEIVKLFSDGRAVDPVAFDGTQSAPSGYAISIWRGVALTRENTRLTAKISASDGKELEVLTRDVHFAETPARFEVVPHRSRLIADGTTRPVLAVRILDRQGRPVHAGLTGSFSVNAPYESAAQLDAMQTRQLSRLGRAAPTWVVKGDDGIALIELAPTMVSGALQLDFSFADGATTRRQKLEAWVVPGSQEWTLIGLAEGTVGARSVAANMERGGNFESDLGNNARIAFYAKGRVLGRYLLTLAYDSAKQRYDQRLLGAIDPNSYYTVFADGSDRRFDAASREKLYIRVEGRTFYALYGDFSTGFDKATLSRYLRTMTGVKVEGVFGQAQLQGFAARSADLHRRDEFQGAGISGPYRLSSRAILPNSETVVIEVRDRFRSELIIERRTLVRFVDYDIDLLAGTISFKEPILSRDMLLNPRFIVLDYDVEREVSGRINAGLRAEVGVQEGAIRLGSTIITDTASADGSRAQLAAVDLRAKIGTSTELRAEAALSRNSGVTSDAWLLEAEHHDDRLDLLAYVRSATDGFGLGQFSGAEQGRRKVGVDGRYRVTDALAINLSTWYDDSLIDQSSRRAIETGVTYRSEHTEARVGVTAFQDRLSDGSLANSTVLEGGLTRRFLENRLEISGSAQLAIGRSESTDLPSRYEAGIRYALSPSVKLTSKYEIAEGEVVRARTARAGLEVTPWDGGRVLGTIGQQDIAEAGKRSFATFGLTQSMPLSANVTIDATLDSARTIGGFDVARLVNVKQPASSGGLIGESGALTEDFTAVTFGATWRKDRWAATARGEYRDGALADRTGLTIGLIRQLGEGNAVGAGMTWTRATASAGQSSEVLDAAISAAIRPAGSAFAALTKFEYRSDAVTGASLGEAGAAGRSAVIVDGDAKARRLIGSISANWSPKGSSAASSAHQTEIGLFAAIRQSFDQYDSIDLKGTSLLGGLDLRVNIASRIEIGGQATVRHSVSSGTTSFAVGPQIGVTVAKNVLLTAGYNVTGFRDRDFSDSRTTSRGMFAAIRMKFDASLLNSVGLAR